MKKFILKFINERISELEKENKLLWNRLGKLEDIKRKYKKGDVVYFWVDNSDKVIEATIIGFASGPNNPFIIVESNGDKYFKYEKDLINLK